MAERIRSLRPIKVLSLLLALGVCAIALHQTLFWTLPSYYLDRVRLSLEWHARAGLFWDGKGSYYVSFVPGVTDSRLSDAVEIVSPLGSIALIDIPSGTLTSRGYEPLARLQQLKELRISECPLDAQGMEDIVRIPGLERLFLTNISLDSATLSPLRNTMNLQFLSIDYGMAGVSVNLDAKALEDLCAIGTLKELRLFGVGVSTKELEAMRTRRPDLKIMP